MHDVVDRVSGYRLDPSSALVLATAGVALLAVVVDGVWRWTRNLITIVHEAGHAVVAMLTGRRLTGIRLHSDTSGLTLSVGRPEGAGMVLTAAAGYLAPSLLGLCGVAVLAAGRVTVALWVAVGLLLAMLTLIRNGYGALSILVTGTAIGLVAWYASADTQAAFGHAAVWFLLIGGVRPVFELRRQRRRGQARNSDADQLGTLTRVPAPLWIFMFALTALAALAGGGWLLLR
ncbi:MAG TPA: M50 family metallopeptidase [Mycobacteriales bacterium]|nr:M50 family metallopeptidase [Mycobacteriales bacterium]